MPASKCSDHAVVHRRDAADEVLHHALLLGDGVHAELGEDVALTRQHLRRAGEVAVAQGPEDVDVGGVLDAVVVGRLLQRRHRRDVADVELPLDAPGQAVGEERGVRARDRCS